MVSSDRRWGRAAIEQRIECRVGAGEEVDHEDHGDEVGRCPPQPVEEATAQIVGDRRYVKAELGSELEGDPFSAGACLERRPTVRILVRPPRPIVAGWWHQGRQSVLSGADLVGQFHHVEQAGPLGLPPRRRVDLVERLGRHRRVVISHPDLLFMSPSGYPGGADLVSIEPGEPCSLPEVGSDLCGPNGRNVSRAGRMEGSLVGTVNRRQTSPSGGPDPLVGRGSEA
jgi:hypothetical protein